ncbi:MAG: ribosome hibernation-promoting factor, HPF/YfiA family [Nitrospinota bacterium]
MHVAITARHIHLTQALKERAEERVQRLERLLDPPVSANVVLSVQKYRQLAEITLQGNGFTLHGAGVTDDLYTAIDNAVEKLRRQIEKHRVRFVSGKIREKQRHSEAVKSRQKVAQEPGEEASEEETPVEPAQPGGVPAVGKTSRIPVTPMSVEEATHQLISKDYNFFLFQNALTEEINVVYLLGNGEIGLIAPVLS